MDSIKYLACIMVCQTFCMGDHTASNCEKCVTKKIINGYSCPTANRTTEHSNVPHHLCSHHCVSVVQWSMLSCHINKAVCLLYKDISVELVDDEGQVFSSIIFNRSSPNACISWLPYQGNIPAGEWLRHPMRAFFREIGPLWGESTGHRWIPPTKTSDAELRCFLWSALKQTVGQTIETLVIWDAIAFIMTSG